MLLLKAFAGGADGIIVSGCHPNDCHYTSETSMHVVVGLYSVDCSTSWELMYVVSVIHGCRREGGKWADLVNETVAGIRELGPIWSIRKLRTIWKRRLSMSN